MSHSQGYFVTPKACPCHSRGTTSSRHAKTRRDKLAMSLARTRLSQTQPKLRWSLEALLAAARDSSRERKSGKEGDLSMPFSRDIFPAFDRFLDFDSIAYSKSSRQDLGLLQKGTPTTSHFRWGVQMETNTCSQTLTRLAPES